MFTYLICWPIIEFQYRTIPHCNNIALKSAKLNDVSLILVRILKDALCQWAQITRSNLIISKSFELNIVN